MPCISGRDCFAIVIFIGLVTTYSLLLSTDKFCQVQELETEIEISRQNLIRKSIESSGNKTQELPKWPENSITLPEYYPPNPEKILVGPAVYLRLKGGMGNQLFQYACHYALARSNDWPLYIFLNTETRLKNRTWGTLQREYALDLFNIPLGDWNLIDETWNVTGVSGVTDAFMLSNEYPRDGRIIQQSGVDYCQSEVFFSPYKSEILDLFWPLKPPIPYWASKIAEVGANSVAVHVRRGDYVKLNAAVPLQFFRKSMQDIGKLLKGGGVPTFFMFSDAIDYLEENLFDPQDPFMKSHTIHWVSDPEVTTSFQELQLISLCRHQIISFSSFGWWGAYLNRNPDKIVLAAHAPESLINTIYEKNKQQKEFFLWEYRHIYYPIDWRAEDPDWTATS